MDKFSFIALWDTYRGLLTPTQQEITDLYFNIDLTVSEIAEQKRISRQAVSECLKGCKRQLEEYEEKLGFAEKYSSLTAEVFHWSEEFKAKYPEFSQEVEKLVSKFKSTNY